ncbi:hypothetical protein [Ectorhizobium quercum]|uniref:hypothetical protein n=1 Tax=Ectorhizobium quercum TaxID=2965071 RepID=UPI003F9A133E
MNNDRAAAAHTRQVLVLLSKSAGIGCSQRPDHEVATMSGPHPLNQAVIAQALHDLRNGQLRKAIFMRFQDEDLEALKWLRSAQGARPLQHSQTPNRSAHICCSRHMMLPG